MQYAIVHDERQEASPGGRGSCPACRSEVIAKCGEINAWHWAHAHDSDCDSWSEGETEWHLAWKRRFYSRWREFVIEEHRADVKSPQGVIELQASAISPSEIAARENFYGEMVWVIDARAFNLDLRNQSTYVSFRWKHPRKTWWTARKVLYFDLGDCLLRIKRIHPNLPCGGWGQIVSYSDFVKCFSKPKAGQQLCESCRMPHAQEHLNKTGMYEYYTMDLDPGTIFCADCYEKRLFSHIPDDPELYDIYTPTLVY